MNIFRSGMASMLVLAACALVGCNVTVPGRPRDVTPNAELRAAIELEYRNGCRLAAFSKAGIDWRAGEASAKQRAVLTPLMDACSRSTVTSMTMRGPLDKGINERHQDRAVAAVIKTPGATPETSTHYFRTVGNKTPYIIASITESAYEATFD